MYFVMSFEGYADERNVGKVRDKDGKSGFTIRCDKDGISEESRTVLDSLWVEISRSTFPRKFRCVFLPRDEGHFYLFEIHQEDEELLQEKFKRFKTKFHNIAHAPRAQLYSTDSDGFQKRFHKSPDEAFASWVCHQGGD